MKTTPKTARSKHREIEQILRQEIVSGQWKPGDRLPGEHELAARFDVAYMTVRQAVSHMVEAGLLRRLRGKGTFVIEQDQPHSATMTGQPLALVFPADRLRVDPYYFPELLDGFQQRMKERDLSFSLYNYDQAEAPGALAAGSLVACLLLEEPHLHLVERLRDGGHRVLAVNHYRGHRSIPCVRIDDAQGIVQAVGHLAALGHEKIGFVRGDPGNLDAADRRRGFRLAVRHYGLRFVTEGGGGFTEASGYAAAQEMLASASRPTALICASDISAVGAMKAAREKGLSIPRDLSIIGFGDFSVADYIMPSLTTVRQSRIALGREAADMLIRLADNETIADSILSADLVVRESTAPRGPVTASS